MRETKDSKGRIRIDEKHSLIIIESNIPAIIKSTNNQLISDDEPRILFRGRDKLALKMLLFYRSLCISDKVTDYQLESLDKMIKEFKEFSNSSPTMKQSGSTLGK